MRILGRTLALKAEVVVLNGLSSHADHGELLRSLGPLAVPPGRCGWYTASRSARRRWPTDCGRWGSRTWPIPDRGDQVIV